MARALEGLAALVTGVGRRRGIGFAIASRLVRAGADVMISHFGGHDAEQPWGTDDPAEVRAALLALQSDQGQRLHAVDADLSGPTVCDEVVDVAVAEPGALE